MKRNKSYNFTQPNVQVYDDASSTQPTLTSNMYVLHITEVVPYAKHID